MTLLILAHMLILIACIQIGKENLLCIDYIKSFPDKKNSPVMRLTTFWVAVLGHLEPF